MLKVKILNILGKKYKLPLTHFGVMVGQYIQISRSISKPEKTQVDKKNIFSVLLDCDINVFKDIDIRWLDILYDKLKYFKSEYDISYNNYFKINGEYYYLKNIEELNLLEYIDLRNHYSNIEEEEYDILNLLLVKCKIKRSIKNKIINFLYNRIDRIPNVIYPPTSHVHEIYKGDTPTYDLWDHLPYLFFKKIIYNNVNDMNKVVEQFSYLYGIGDVSDKYNLEKHGIDTVMVEETPLSNYGLYKNLNDITGGSKQEIDYWLKLPFKEFLSHIQYKKIDDENTYKTK